MQLSEKEKNEVRIDLARPEDAQKAQLVFYLTWLDTYPNEEYGITREAIKNRFAKRLTREGLAEFAAKIAAPEPNTSFLVARLGKKIIGVCRLRKDQEKNQLSAIYVLPEFQRLGIGYRFWQEAKEFFDAGRDIIVQAAVYNDKAINFYKKLGFTDTGKRFTQPHGDIIIPEMEMIIKNQ